MAVIRNLEFPSSGSFAHQGTGFSGANTSSRYNGRSAWGFTNGNSGVSAGVNVARNPADMFQPYTIPKNQAGLNAVNSMLDDFSKNTDVADFSALLKGEMEKLKSGSANIDSAYNRYADTLNIDELAAKLRGMDAGRSALTEGLAGDFNAIGSRYGNVLDTYRREGVGALNDYRDNAAAFMNEDIPASIRSALDAVQKNAKLYGMGSGTGYSSGIANMVARGAVDATLPYKLQGRQYMGDALSRYAPFYGDIASRESGKISGFDVPLTQAIYGNRVGDIEQSRATETNLQRMAMEVAGLNYEAAVQRLTRDFGLSAVQAAKLYQIGQQLRAGQVSNLGGALSLLPQVQWQGLEYLPGARALQPWYNTPSTYRGGGSTLPESRYSAAGEATPPASNFSTAYGRGADGSFTWGGTRYGGGPVAATPGADRFMGPTWDENLGRVIYPSEARNISANNRATMQRVAESFIPGSRYNY